MSPLDTAIARLTWMRSKTNRVMTIALVITMAAIVTTLAGTLARYWPLAYCGLVAGATAFAVYLYANTADRHLQDLAAVLRGDVDEEVQS